MNFRSEVEDALAGTHNVSNADYLRWTREGDLATRARVRRLAEVGWSRIQPEPSTSEHWTFVTAYLLDCILQDPTVDDYIHSGFEAAHDMAAWLKYLASIEDGAPVVVKVAETLASAYKASDDTTRNRLETGTIEHALESARVRPFLSSWAVDPILREAYEPALKWGLAHPDPAG